MSDPNFPTDPTRVAAATPGTPRDEYNRTSFTGGNTTVRPEPSNNGVGTGMLVAGVFVVLGIIALFMFTGRDEPVPGASPDVSIENTNVPAADPAPAPGVVPDPAPTPAPSPADPIPVPDTGTADPVLPTPDPAAPANP